MPDKIIFPTEEVLRRRELVNRELKLLRDLKSQRGREKRFLGKAAGRIVVQEPHMLEPFDEVA